MQSTNREVESSLFETLYPKDYQPYRIKRFDILIALVLFLIAAIGYIKTLTPSVCAGDSGELTTAIYNMGSAHPPGYPVYSILGKLFTFLPIGDIAHRVNLFSAFSGAASIFFLYLILIKLLGLNRDTGKLDLSVHLPAIAGSFLFAFTTTQWSQAVIGEVYALNSVLLAAMIFVMVLWYEEMIFFRNESRLHFAERMTYLLAFAMGMSITNHQLPVWYIITFVLILLPTTILIVVSERSEAFLDEFKDRGLWFIVLLLVGGVSFVLFLQNGYNLRLIRPQHVPYILTAIFLPAAFLTTYTGVVKLFKPEANWVDKLFEILTVAYWIIIFAVTLYLYLVVRAKAIAPLPEPKPFSWGDTQNLSILFNQMMRKQYGAGGGGNLRDFGSQFMAVVNMNFKNFHWINMVIGLIGFVYFAIKEKVWAAYTFISMLIFVRVMIWFVNFGTDPRTLSFQEVMYIQQFFFYAIYIAFGYQLFYDLASGKILNGLKNFNRKNSVEFKKN